MAPMSVVMLLRIPVTPRLDTTYTKPLASRAIMAMRCSDVGAMREMKSSPYWRHRGANSSFSSKGTSGRISPSMPMSRQAARNFSVP